MSSKKYVSQVAVLILIFMFSVGCEKHKSKSENTQENLPPVTTEGKNTFGCIINGKVWLPKGVFPRPLQGYYSNGGLQIKVVREYPPTEDDKSDFFNISHRANTFDTGFYNISDTLVVHFAAANHCSYFNDKNILNGHLHLLRVDTIYGIFSGTFEFTIIPDDDGCDTLNITNGRFDLKL